MKRFIAWILIFSILLSFAPKRIAAEVERDIGEAVTLEETMLVEKCSDSLMMEKSELDENSINQNEFITYETAMATGSDIYTYNILNTNIVLEYTISDGNAAIVNCNADAVGELIIPNVLNGNIVTSIASNAFLDCTGIETVVCNQGLKTIGSNAFANCTSLREMNMQEGLLAIEARAFTGCAGLESIQIPDSVETIGYRAFEGCSNLKNVNYPKNLINTGSTIFAECKNMKRIEVPEGVTKIPDSAFRWCADIEEIVLPETIKEIGQESFYYCNGLKSIFYAGTEEKWKSIIIGRDNEVLSNVTIYYNSKAYNTNMNGTGVVEGESGENEICISCTVKGNSDKTLYTRISNELKSIFSFLSDEEKGACTLNDAVLTVTLPEGMVFSETGSNSTSYSIEKLALENDITFQDKVTTTLSGIVNIDLHLAIGGTRDCYLNTSVIISRKGVQTISPDEDINEDLAKPAETIKLVSGRYGEEKITNGQNVEIPRGAEVIFDTLTVEGDLTVYGTLTANKIIVTKDGWLTVVGTTTINQSLKMDGGFPIVHVAGSFDARNADVTVNQGAFRIDESQNADATIRKFDIKYGGVLYQWGGNLFIKEDMEVSSSDTSKLTGGNLWLAGDFKQSWHKGNFKASDTHSTIRLSSWDGSNTKFKKSDVYFNNFYVDESFAGISPNRDLNEFVEDHVRGEIYSAKVDLKNMTFEKMKDLDPQHTWETGLLKAMDTNVQYTLSSNTLKSLLGKERYDFVLKAVAEWYATATSPLVKNEFTEDTYRLEYLEIQLDEDVIVVYTEGAQWGEYAMFGTMMWYGRIGDQVFSKENSQLFGITAMTSLNNFQRQMAVYLATEAIDHCTAMLGKGVVKSYNNLVSHLIELGLEYSDQYEKVESGLTRWNAACERIKDQSELPNIGGTRSVSTPDAAVTRGAACQSIVNNTGTSNTKDIVEISLPIIIPSVKDAEAMIVSSGSIENNSEDEIVIFEDEVLKMAILQVLGKMDETEITVSDAQKITALNLSDFSLYSLKGLEAFTGLRELNLSGNNFCDLTPLSELNNLETLDLSHNRIKDISQLSNLTNLKNLSIAYNLITDLTALSNLKVLERLEVQYNPIADFEVFEQLINLQQLDISGVELPDGNLDFLSGQENLTLLYASKCGLMTAQGLTSNVLEYLDLRSNQITMLGDLILNNSKSIVLSDNPIIDISALCGASDLYNLQLGNCGITDETISVLSDMTSIRCLDIASNQITKLDFLVNMESLQRVDVSDNQLVDISALENKTALEVLCMDNCGITDTSTAPLAGLTGLRIIQMQDNELENVEFLSEMNELEFADFSDNVIDKTKIPEGMEGILDVSAAPKYVKKLEINIDFEEIYIGETVDADCYSYPAMADDTNLKWESSNEAIARVDEYGKITGISSGEVTIMVSSANGITESIQVSVSEQSLLDSGDCGENLEWKFYSDGKLVIYGYGEMQNYESVDVVPWNKHHDEIESVTFKSDITKVSNFAFDGYEYLTDITFEGDAPSIEEFAFREVVATIRYPKDNETWTQEKCQDYGGKITWTDNESGKEEFINPFTDVAENAYYYNPVLWAVDNGVTAGYTQTLFAPEIACTRGQVVTFLWRAMGEQSPDVEECSFVDVKRDAYYYEAVLWAVENGITSGLTENVFAPEATVTRGQFVSFLYRALGKGDFTIQNPFSDVKESTYYYRPVLWAAENKVTSGLTETEFGPETSCTRGQVVSFLYRALVDK